MTDKLTPKQQNLYDLLLASIEPLRGSGQRQDGSASSAGTLNRDIAGSTEYSPYCAAIIKEQQLQYHFMALYQSLMAFLAVLCLLLVVAAAICILRSLPSAGLLTGAGGIVSGVFSVWLARQRKDARDANAAALKALKTAGCSS